MTDTNRILAVRWTRERAALLAGVCLLLGIAGGWSIRGSHRSAAADAVQTGRSAIAPANVAGTGSAVPAAARLKEMAETQAAPLLEKLKSDPHNPDLLTGVGNVYYDAQQYPNAIDYYVRALKVKPSDAAVRTDLGTAYWYMGNPDAAIAEFKKALVYEPNNPNTLFNLGLVRWKGKKDGAGALGDWNKLLAANPNYEGKDKVEKMMNEVKSQSPATPEMASK